MLNDPVWVAVLANIWEPTPKHLPHSLMIVNDSVCAQDAEAQEWLSSPDVAFDEVASTWEAVGRLSDLYDEALNDSMKKVRSAPPAYDQLLTIKLRNVSLLARPLAVLRLWPCKRPQVLLQPC